MDTQDPSTSRDVQKNDKLYEMYHTKYNSLLKQNLSKENFTREYRKLWDKRWKQKGLYLTILYELKAAMVKGELIKFKNLETHIRYLKDIEHESKLKDFYNSERNPIKNTNLVILACKYNNAEILKHIFSRSSNILNNLSVDIGRDAISFKDEDESCHNAFYYCLVWGNLTLLDMITSKWVIAYSPVQLLELDKTLSNVFEEVQLMNVLLSDDIRIYVENRLVALRFFADDVAQCPTVINNFANIIERIQLVIEHVTWLADDYSGSRKIDNTFLFLIKSVTKNIHILKQQLKSTYNKIPWEEMEFCLISFILSHLEIGQINFFSRLTLNKTKVLRYLNDFVKVLENVGHFALFTDLPKGEPEIVTARIIKTYPQFKELYADHRQLRDVYSLRRMDDYIKLALSADPRQIPGQTTILRAIHVMGDCLKNTLESPKLSKCMSKLLLLSLSDKTRRVVMVMRDSHPDSHADSLAIRMKIEDNEDVKFFVNVLDDIKEISVMIDGILREKRRKMMKILLEKITKTKSLDDIEEAFVAFNAMRMTYIKDDYETLELDDLQVLVKELDSMITDEADDEESLVPKILKTAEAITENSCREINTFDYLKPFELLKRFSFLHSCTNKIDSTTDRYMKVHAKEALQQISCSADSSSQKHIRDLLNPLLTNSALTMRYNDSDLKLRRIICKISYLFECETRANERIERIWERLKKTVPFKNVPLPKETCDALLARNISELKCLLTYGSLLCNTLTDVTAYKSNKGLQSMVEMMVLNILDCADDCLEDNLFFCDVGSPVLTGKCLRDYLAHDNPLVNVLLADPPMMVVQNATKLVIYSESVIKKKRGKLGRSVTDNCLKLRHKYEERLRMIARQEEMFATLEETRPDDFRRCMRAGVELRGRNSNLWTVLHFVAKGSEVGMVNVLTHLRLDFNARDVYGQSPLHIAAANGRADIIKFFMEKLNYSADVMDNAFRTPLHVAAQTGHQEAVKVLLKNKAKINMEDINRNTPLHYAIMHNCVGVVKILTENGAEINISENPTPKTPPFTLAVELGRVDIVNFFLDNKAVGKDELDVPLYQAVIHGYVEVMEALISNGADVNARVSGHSMLLHAFENQREAVVEVLLKHGADPNVLYTDYNTSALHRSAGGGYKNIVLDLLKNGADVNAETIRKLTPLHFAAERGHLEMVDILISHGSNVHAKTLSGYTPLNYAVLGNHKDVIELLIKHGADVNTKGPDGYAPLHVAASTKKEEIVNLLIKNKAKVNLKDEVGMTPLHVAAVVPSSEKVIELLRKNRASIDLKNKHGLTPLHMAALMGCVDNVSLLIEYKADINAVNNGNETPLHLALSEKHPKVVDILLRNGAVIDETLIVSTLSNAIEFNNKEMVEVLMAHGVHKFQSADNEVIGWAINAGYTEIIEISLKHGAIINALCADDQSTLLHVASNAGNMNVVKTLISQGADVNAADNAGVTPLHAAAYQGHDEVVELLLKNGAMVNVKTSKGNSALHYAAENGYYNIVEILLDNGASINEKNWNNKTALVMAVSHDHLEVVQTLLEYERLDLNADYNGWKLLHIASDIGSIEIIKYLVDQGADVNGKNSCRMKAIHVAANRQIVEYFVNEGLSVNELDARNMRPLHYAVKEGRLEVVQCLIDHGAEVNAKDDEGITPLGIAIKAQFKDIIEVLLKNGAAHNAAHALNKPSSKITKGGYIAKLLKLSTKLASVVKQRETKYKTKLKNETKLKDETMKETNDGKRTKKGLRERKWLKKRAVTNVRDTDNLTPLHCAVLKNHDAIACILLESGSNPDAMAAGHTPLHYAAKYSRLNIAKILLANGATYNVLSDKNETPLDLATDKEIISLLRIIGIAFKTVKDDDARIIYVLTTIYDTETMKALMNARNEDGETLVIAAARNDFSKIDELIELSLDYIPDLIDDARRTKFSSINVPKELSQDCTPDLIDAAMGNKFSNINVPNELLQVGTPDLIDANVVPFERDIYRICPKILKDTYENIAPKDRPPLDVQRKIADAFYEQERYDEALIIYEIIFDDQTETLGSHDRSTLDTRCMIALTSGKLARHEEALDIYRDVHRKLIETLGPDHEEVVKVEFQMGITLTNLERYDEALNIFTTVLEKRKNVFGMNDVRTLRVEKCIALLLHRQGKFSKALRVYIDIFGKEKATFNKCNHTDVFQTLFNIATMLSQEKKYEPAFLMYQELLRLQEQIFGQDHPEALITQYYIIDLYIKQGRLRVAQKIFGDILPRMKAVSQAHRRILSNTLKLMEAAGFSIKVLGITFSNVQKQVNDAAAAGDVKAVEQFFRGGFDLNDSDTDGRTLLHYAASGGKSKVVKFLLENGANINAVCKEGKTPLYTAAENNQISVVDFLLNNKANVNTVCNEGKTPLHAATENNNGSIVKLLVKHVGRDKLNDFINARNVNGATSLHIAAQNGFIDVAWCLLSHGAIYNIEDKEGKTPLNVSKYKVADLLKLIDKLFKTTKKGDTWIVSELHTVKSVPNVFSAVTNARNIQGNTILQVAISNRHKDIANELLKLLK